MVFTLTSRFVSPDSMEKKSTRDKMKPRSTFTAIFCTSKCTYLEANELVSEYHSLVNVFTYFTAYVGGSSKMSHDLSSVKLEVYSNGKICRLLKLVFFIQKCAGILLTGIYI